MGNAWRDAGVPRAMRSFALVGVLTACSAIPAAPPPPQNAPKTAPPPATAAPPAAVAPRPERALFRAYPGLATLPHVSLGRLPTPLEPAPELGRRLGLDLWLKRDDRAGDAYGGSKLRKLELLLGDAEARGLTRVLAQGGMGSNQTLATAFFARQRGLHAILLLLPERPSATTREHLLAQQALGAEQHLTGGDDGAVARFVARLPENERPYVIPTGGSSPLGDVGFVDAAFELAEQVREGGLPQPDAIYLPLGTGGSAAGLALGLTAAGLPTRVVAVRAASQRYGSPAELRKMFHATSALLHARDPSFPLFELAPERIEIENRYVGRGYAEPTPKGRRALLLVREAAGVELDLTYSAKAFAALVDDAPALAGRHVVFWVTYDARQPALPEGDLGLLPRELRPYARP